MEIELTVTGTTLLVLVFISTFENAFGQLSEVALRSLVAEHKNEPKSDFLRHLLDNKHLYWLTITSGMQPCTLVIGICCTSIALKLTNGNLKQGLPLAFILASLLGIPFRQILPRLITQNHPAEVMLFLLPLFRLYYDVFSIPARVIYRMLSPFKKERSSLPDEAEERNEKGEEEIQALIDVAAQEGIIEEKEGQMLQSVLEFGETRVKEVMTPRPELVAIEANATIEEARDLIIDSNRSRLPVYKENIESIEGILHIQDVLIAWQQGRSKDPVKTIARPAYFVPETKPVSELLGEMRKAKCKMVLVVDEYGALAGVVTIKDLIEEIVGEIKEEVHRSGLSEDEDTDIIKQPDGSFIIKGSTEIRKVELLLDKELETDDFSTVAGFIIKHAGCIPNVGDTFEYDGVVAEILEAEHGRVGLIRLKTLSTEEKPQSSS
ncbi:MAG: hemolysin family protein [Acidobacteriota bacterium]|nr:hemolysin family protein [Blastocatellia bacterium]MDW8412309.1 hemolysin family protein [Acidobacteriota bacterium]